MNPLHAVLRPWLCMIFVAAVTGAFAQDRYEVATQIFLHTNRVEIQATLSQKAMTLLAVDDLGKAPDLSTASGFESGMSQLRQASAKLFVLTVPGGRLPMLATNVSPDVEDQIELRLVYALPSSNFVGPLTIEAPGMSRLPREEGYGAAIVVLDMVNKRVLGQKLLTSADSVMEVHPPSTIHHPPILPAAEESLPTPPTPDGRSSVGNPPQPSFWMAVVLALLLGTAWLGRYLSRRR